jgi:dihydroorotase (multifunctional complex type)
MRIDSAKIVTSNGIFHGGILVDRGRIVKIAKESKLGSAETRIDARGSVILPGLIDAHVHLRDLQLSSKETFATGTQAAAVGGFTTVLDMPNSVPPTDSEKNLREKVERAASRIYVNVGFYATLIADPSEMLRMSKAGAIAFKLYMNRQMDDLSLDDTALLRASLLCAQIGKRICVHAEDASLIKERQSKLISKGRSSIRDFLMAHSPLIEAMAIQRILAISRRSGASIHICHLSTRDGVEAVVSAKRNGTQVSCEATPHHLLLNTRIFKKFGSEAITLPPIRSESHRERLFSALIHGNIDIVASDHAPHLLDEKKRYSAWEVSPGIPGLETTLPLLLTLWRKGQITLTQIIDVMGIKPARLFALPRKGEIREGMDADLVIVDPKIRFKINPHDFSSKAKYSPFSGFECRGKAVMTILSGEPIVEYGEIKGKPLGKVLLQRWKP